MICTNAVHYDTTRVSVTGKKRYTLQKILYSGIYLKIRTALLLTYCGTYVSTNLISNYGSRLLHVIILSFAHCMQAGVQEWWKGGEKKEYICVHAYLCGCVGVRVCVCVDVHVYMYVGVFYFGFGFFYFPFCVCFVIVICIAIMWNEIKIKKW